MSAVLLLLTIFLLSPEIFSNPLEEIVVTATRNKQAVGSLSSNISTINSASIDSVNHTHINEVMQRIAGTWISRGNGQEHLTAIRSPVLTGAGGCGAFLMSQDGISVHASGFCNVNELLESHSEVAERIEVVKGPGSALHGSNAMHGLVNVLTPAISTPGSRLQLEAGGHAYTRVKLNHRRENWRVDFSGTTDDGYKDDSGFGQQKLTAKFRGDLTDFSATTTFSYTNLNQETAGFVQGVSAYKVSSLKKTNPNPEAFRDVRSARINSRLEKQLADDHLLTITPYARHIDMTFLQHFLPGQAREENGHTSIGIQTSLYNGNSWVIGFDGEITRGFLKETQAEATQGSPFLVATIPQGDHYDYKVDANTVAFFAQYNLSLSNKTNLIFGSRLERVSFDYDNEILDGRARADGSSCSFGGCRFSRPADRDDSFTNFSPKLGLIHLFSDNHQLYLQLAQGFRAPQATELYRLQAGQTVSTIDSEELDSLEFGLRGGNNNTSYDVSIYTMTKDNFVFRDNNRSNVDNGETSHQGVELTLRWQVSDTISSNLFWSLARHQYENNPALVSTPISGNDIDTAPRTMGSFNITWQPGARSWSAEFEWVHLGDYYTDPQNTTKYEGHDLLNLRFSFDFTTRWTGFLRLMNLTDTDYAERADFGFGNERYFIGEPISLYLGVRHSL
ncbi:MAG: TonB-dependent receptor [Gammaproteobacteria bacterium]|jgi:outer membrane receptor protein involved in Fe transport|nr:TonB-dependent receptor [Gammaproteobacteria bacterium]|tara:strand:- start:1803 stop:3830 length:2028 start_codon:yes stop_codon:yes gene_type:complete